MTIGRIKLERKEKQGGATGVEKCLHWLSTIQYVHKGEKQEALNCTNSVEQLDLGDIYRRLHPTWQTTLYSSVHLNYRPTPCAEP